MALTVQALVNDVEASAANYRIGGLQQIRQRLHGVTRSNKIFSAQTTRPEWAHHDGGRTELQFNLGVEADPGGERWRHGVAFSLQRGKSVHDPVSHFAPRIDRFNEYLRLDPAAVAGMQMWAHLDARDARTTDLPAGPVDQAWVQSGAFIFIGRLRSEKDVDAHEILSDFDRLLPLYEYVEDHAASSQPAQTGFVLQPGCPPRAIKTTATVTGAVINVSIRHAGLQAGVHGFLAKQYGASNVGTENWVPCGGRVDVAVRQGSRIVFFEIKTSTSVRAAIREALAQLIEYSFWPGMQPADKLVIVSEAKAGQVEQQYLQDLRSRLGLPLYYRSFDLSTGQLGPEH